MCGVGLRDDDDFPKPETWGLGFRIIGIRVYWELGLWVEGVGASRFIYTKLVDLTHPLLR